MEYKAKDFSSLYGMEGFSEKLLSDHFKLYQGYVSNVNQILEELRSPSGDEESASIASSEMRRRLGWEFDGMRLHELYFGNLGGKGALLREGDIPKLLHSSFGGTDPWTADFRATAAMRGIGWAVLYFDPIGDRLLNFWINEHDTGHPAGCVPLLVMDVWEHAFMTDYGTDRGSYIDAFMANVEWREVERRLFAARATHAAAH
jgi:Fe-Mn family superoxide dismutase